MFQGEMVVFEIERRIKYTEFHLESRYPDRGKNYFYEKCAEAFARQKFSEIEGVYQWLIGKLEI